MRACVKLALSLFASVVVACSSSDDGEGTATFTTYGEDYIEQEIPAADVEDGWSVKYERFLITISDVSVGASGQPPVARMPAAKLFEMKKSAGDKPVVSFASLRGKAYDHVSYVVAPTTAAAELGPGVLQADKDLMVQNGYSVYVEATVTKGADAKKLAWGFKTNTLYDRCKGEVDGKETDGVVVTNGGTDTVQLTIHGDHFFYDHLQAAEAKVRFTNIALADADDDGTVTLEELAEKRLADLDPANGPYGTGSAANVNDLRAFVEALSRTLGHFRGEGECIASGR